MRILEQIGHRLARFLARPRKRDSIVSSCKPELLLGAIRKGDVLLIEGSSRLSTAIKYLTQSTWSHAALYVSDQEYVSDSGFKGGSLLEADVLEGVRLVSLSEYWDFHTRICRPVGLTPEEIEKVVKYAAARIGNRYDLKNLIDLARYLIQTPPVPARWRRRMLALGSGDPTKAICSSLIAQAFQSVRYPILPEIEIAESNGLKYADSYQEILHIRHHSLFVPRDFDISPYFRIVKPTLENGFDPHHQIWA